MATLTTREAAATAHVAPATIRTWCRTGRLAAAKQHGRWAIRVSAIARMICPATDRPRRGEHPRLLDPRAARRATARVEARQVAREHRTRLIGHHQRARIAAANTGHTLARDFLYSLGLDTEFVLKYESAFGRAVAKTYRANHNAEPKHGGLVVLRGRLWHTMRYRDIADLEAGARAYPRTRNLLALAA